MSQDRKDRVQFEREHRDEFSAIPEETLRAMRDSFAYHEKNHPIPTNEQINAALHGKKTLRRWHRIKFEHNTIKSFQDFLRERRLVEPRPFIGVVGIETFDRIEDEVAETCIISKDFRYRNAMIDRVQAIVVHGMTGTRDAIYIIRCDHINSPHIFLTDATDFDGNTDELVTEALAESKRFYFDDHPATTDECAKALRGKKTDFNDQKQFGAFVREMYEARPKPMPCKCCGGRPFQDNKRGGYRWGCDTPGCKRYLKMVETLEEWNLKQSTSRLAGAVHRFFSRWRLRAMYAAMLPWRGVKSVAFHAWYADSGLTPSQAFVFRNSRCKLRGFTLYMPRWLKYSAKLRYVMRDDSHGKATLRWEDLW